MIFMCSHDAPRPNKWKIWDPNSRAFHAVEGPFTQREVLFTDFHGNSRMFCAHPSIGAESRVVKNVKNVCVCFSYVSQSALYCMFYVLFYVIFLLCFAVCSLFYVKCMFVSVCFCYQFALYFMCYVMFPLCFHICSLFFLKKCMFLYISPFASLFCVFCFVLNYVSQFALYFKFYALFYGLFMLSFCFKTSK